MIEHDCAVVPVVTVAVTADMIRDIDSCTAAFCDSVTLISACIIIILMISVVEQGFFMNSHSTTKRLKHASNFEFVENVRKF